MSKKRFCAIYSRFDIAGRQRLRCLQKIKSIGDRPVIFLTAYDDEVNVVMGFDLGADDYITKPFRLKELLVRIKSVLRRYNRTGSDATVKIKNITINTNEAKVYKTARKSCSPRWNTDCF